MGNLKNKVEISLGHASVLFLCSKRKQLFFRTFKAHKSTTSFLIRTAHIAQFTNLDRHEPAQKESGKEQIKIRSCHAVSFLPMTPDVQMVKKCDRSGPVY